MRHAGNVEALAQLSIPKANRKRVVADRQIGWQREPMRVTNVFVDGPIFGREIARIELVRLRDQPKFVVNEMDKHLIIVIKRTLCFPEQDNVLCRIGANFVWQVEADQVDFIFVGDVSIVDLGGLDD